MNVAIERCIRIVEPCSSHMYFRIEVLEAALYEVQSNKQNFNGMIDVPQSVQPNPWSCQDGVLYSGSYGPSVGALVPKEGKDTSELKQKRVPSPPQFDGPNFDEEKKHTVQPPSTELLSAVVSQEKQRSKRQESPPPSKQRVHSSSRRDTQESHPKHSSACGKENRRGAVQNVTTRWSEGQPMAQCEVKSKERPTLKEEERQHDSMSLRRRGSKLERYGHKRQLSPSPVRHNSRTESTRAKRRKVDSVGDSTRPQQMKVPKEVHRKSLPRPVDHRKNGGEGPVGISNKASAKEDTNAGKSHVLSMDGTVNKIANDVDSTCRRRIETKPDEQHGMEFSQRKSNCVLPAATTSPDPSLESCAVDFEAISDSAAKSPGGSTIIPATTVGTRSSLTPTPTPEESPQLEDGEILSDSDSDVRSQPIPGPETTTSTTALSKLTVSCQKSQLTSREKLDKHLDQSVLQVSSQPPDQTAVVKSKTLYRQDPRPDCHRRRAVIERHERDHLPSRSHHKSRESSRPKPWVY